MTIDTEKFKKKLEEEKSLLIEELKSIGHPNPKIESDWQADPDTSGVVEGADKNLAADRHEDFEERSVVNAALEERLANVSAALGRIEDGTYGVCKVGGKEIEIERLEANHAAATCKEHLEG